jgi:hypothetical protein
MKSSFLLIAAIGLAPVSYAQNETSNPAGTSESASPATSASEAASAQDPAAETAAAPEEVKAPEEVGDKRVLVLELEAVGVEKEIAEQATEAIAAAFAGRAGYSAVTLKDLKAAVELEKQQVATGCKVDLSCLAEVSAWADAELVVNGSVGLVGESLTLNLALVESASVNVQNKVSVVLASAAEIPTKAPEAVAELFGWDTGATGPKYKLPEGEEVSFAVFDLAAAGVTPELATNLTQILSGEIKRVEGTTVIGRDDIAALVQLEKEKTMLGCTDDIECLAEIGSALGVQKLIVGQIGILGDSFVISIRLLDTASVNVDNRITESFAGDEGQLIGAMREAGRRLIGIDATEPGTLQVTASEVGSTVFVDGEEVGKMPLPPITDMAPGRHTVRITKKDFFEKSSDVYVNPGETSALWMVLEEKPAGLLRPFLSPWILYGAAIPTTVAAIVGAIGLSGYTGYLYFDDYTYHAEQVASHEAGGFYDQKGVHAREFPEPFPQTKKKPGIGLPVYAVATGVAWAASMAFAAGAGLVSLFTDFDEE